MRDWDDETEEEEAPPLVGPQRPSARSVNFWPKGSRGLDRMDQQAAEARAQVLFGTAWAKDPLEKGRIDGIGFAGDGVRRLPDDRASSTFKLVPSEFLRHAQKMRPEKPEATVSAFSQWIYSLYGQAFGDDEDRERGKAMEQEILERRAKAACCVNNGFLRSIDSDWRLIHNGLHVRDRDHVDYFTIDSLNVNGEPLRASPDLVYRNQRFSEVIIVEIKYSRMQIPANLWPNIWGQLWCYAQIDIARNASSLTAVGEVWGESWTRGYGRGRNYTPGVPLVSLRASVRRDPRSAAYDRFFRALFEIYGGRGGTV
ncbi:MAG: hypothetical protein V4793_18920 [Paraburkholderia tropica]|uniref:Uncharacterized protein n=1 Tax=Paraburkholderia tropica TaxID=92647 RepID=A0ABX5MZK9_9BURK|nr:hypothetical protein [Paraburkholderia tropica]MDE1140716.1 hypothetical protein [Paraburkholderia tropica]PXX19132.1 hypothetical protein C7400_103123 [Paraburkholderia tropica]PZW88155.1 hypothetical protein C7399_103123 [Paraburkholderia tropica]